MARVKVINKNLNEDLIGSNFTNTASKTIFSLGDFAVETNFTGRRNRDYSNTISSFSKEITLETLALTPEESKTISERAKEVHLNFEKSDIKSYVKFGSAAELLRTAYEEVIIKYPASLYVSTQVLAGGNSTVFDFNYDNFTNTSTFRVPSTIIENNFGLSYDFSNTSFVEGEELSNLNLSFSKYIIWRKDKPDNFDYKIIGFTGDTPNNSAVTIKVNGNPFPEASGNIARVDYHIRPNALEYNKFLNGLTDLQRHFVSKRSNDLSGFEIKLKKVAISDIGDVRYNDTIVNWLTIDGYNPLIKTSAFSSFKETIANIGQEYDKIKTDLIARFLTPSSLKVYDLTDDGKMSKLLRIYGREFDQLRIFIDAIATINKVSYDKKDNIPDVLVKNLARTLGWDVFDLVTEQDITQSFFSTEKDFDSEDLLPSEIDIELWRRILINTNYFWKSKGTRNAIKSMFLLIGIPEPFINITEYVYTVEGKINPNEVTLSLEDIPSASFPFDSEGYPIAPVETDDFYFQISGDSDGGQSYINLYRNLGFRVNRTVDNKKSWTQEGFVERVHYSTPNYFQEDSKLLINTKEIDITLDISRGIEYDVYCYNKEIDSQFTSTGVTKPYIYINVELDINDPTEFLLPETPLENSEVQLNFNGITLTPETSGAPDYDYIYVNTGSTPSVKINPDTMISASTGQDVISITYLYDRLNTSGYTEIKYFVQRPTVLAGGTILQFDEEPKGDVQLTVNGITMSKGNSLYTGDYIINPLDRTQLIIRNDELKNYLLTNPVIRIWSINDNNNITNAEKRSEVHRIDSLSSNKLFFNGSTNQYTYVMNFEAFDEEAIKVTLNGITLTNGKDFKLNLSNKRQIYIPNKLNLGDIISVYYIIDGGVKYTSDSINFVAPNIVNVPLVNISVLKRGNDINISGSTSNDGFYKILSSSENQIILDTDDIVTEFSGQTVTITKTSNNALLPPDPTFPDIGEMTFLEYLELITRRLINVPRRKTISDNNGGYYPTVQKIYEEYLRRSYLPDTDPLKSNGYTFGNLYPFINQYNGFFNRFVKQLLPATIIQRKSGILIRNTVFNRQKFRYPRGVNFDQSLNWIGTDGSEFVNKVDLSLSELPTSATLEFVNDIPVGSRGTESVRDVENGDSFEFDIRIASSFYSPVPYRLRIEVGSEFVGVTDLIGNDVLGDGDFFNNSLIASGTVETNILVSFSGIFNKTISQNRIINFVLLADKFGDGNFVETDRIRYLIVNDNSAQQPPSNI